VVRRKPEERAHSLSNRVAWMKRCAARWNHCSVMMSGRSFSSRTPPDDVASSDVGCRAEAVNGRATLGHYRVVSLWVRWPWGGYRATDTRLDRQSCQSPAYHLSSIPSSGSGSSGKQEQYPPISPHISRCTMWVNRTASTYLVMEYIEASRLQTRLAKGPLPVDHALRYGIQVADALDKAHRARLVHET